MHLSAYKVSLCSYFFVWLLVIFGPVLDLGIGPFSDLSFLVCFILIFFGSKIYVDRFYVFLSSLLFAICMLALFTAIFFDYSELAVGLRAILRPIRVLVVMWAVIILSNLTVQMLSKRFPNDDVLEIYLKALSIVYGVLVLHAVIMVSQFLFPTFRDFVYQFTMAKYQLDFYQNFRMAGLSGAGGAQVSFVQGLGFCLGAFLWSKVHAKKTIIVLNFILVFSVILSGRSGLIPVFLVILFFVFKSLIWMFNFGVIKKEFFSKSSVFWLLTFFSAIAFGVVRLLENEYVVIALERTFATFISYSETGEFSDNTLVALSNMFVLPSEFLHILFGKASYLETNTFYDFNTDIGYFRLIWGYGVLGLGIHIAFYCAMLLVSIRLGVCRRFFLEVNVFLVLLIFLFNSKEIFFFSKMSFQICFASFAIALCLVNKHRSRFLYESIY